MHMENLTIYQIFHNFILTKKKTMKSLHFIFLASFLGLIFQGCNKQDLSTNSSISDPTTSPPLEILLLSAEPWKYEKIDEYINGQYNRTIYPGGLSKFIFTPHYKFYYYDSTGSLKSYGHYKFFYGNPDYLVYTSENLGTVYTYYLIHLSMTRYTVYNEWTNASGNRVRWVYYLYRPK